MNLVERAREAATGIILQREKRRLATACRPYCVVTRKNIFFSSQRIGDVAWPLFNIISSRWRNNNLHLFVNPMNWRNTTKATVLTVSISPLFFNWLCFISTAPVGNKQKTTLWCENRCRRRWITQPHGFSTNSEHGTNQDKDSRSRVQKKKDKQRSNEFHWPALKRDSQNEINIVVADDDRGETKGLPPPDLCVVCCFNPVTSGWAEQHMNEYTHARTHQVDERRPARTAAGAAQRTLLGERHLYFESSSLRVH